MFTHVCTFISHPIDSCIISFKLSVAFTYKYKYIKSYTLNNIKIYIHILMKRKYGLTLNIIANNCRRIK